ncbi:BatA domain-containing protein [Humisphaera borealis]|uniref:BatA domain-containing protein n=1 Tax=Humisphaera borealis TaxID=2807512 RepID=A0A7M2WX19_9BACT|nr:BatA domain-containing protein [Humisphaera borealis]QOV89943.1 BatA domain-containing protein [Humisphaera borealis]
MPNILAITLLNPLFLGGLALISIPIIIHILNRQRFKIVDWAAMEFLLRAMRKNRKRLKLEQLILLLTRCAVVGLIAFALVRPMGGCGGDAIAGLGGRAGVNVFVIDNSYSAAYETTHTPVPSADGTPLPPAKTHLEQQKLMAKRLIDTLAGGGESVAIITAARPASAVIAKPGYNLAEAKAVIDRIEQSYAGTDLAGALTLANGIADDDKKVPTRTLYLFTDGTRSAWEGASTDALKRLGPEVAARYSVTHFNMTEGKAQWNAAVLDVRPATNLVTTRFDSDLLGTARGYGTGGSGESSLQWLLDGQPLGKVKTLRLEPGTPPDAAKVLPTQVKVGGPHLFTVQLNTEQPADSLKIDDKRYRVVDVASELKVLIVEGVRAQKFMESSGAFLQLALAPPIKDPVGIGAPRSATHVSTELISDGELDRKALGDYRAVVLCGVPQLNNIQAEALAAFVQNGGTLMFFMGEKVNKENYNANLLPLKLLPGPLTRLIDNREQGTPFVFDFSPNPNATVHRYLQSFKGVANTGLDTARINTFWQVDISGNTGVERVLSYVPAPDPATGEVKKLPEGYKPDAAITSHSLGLGTVVFVSTTASPTTDKGWHNLPAKGAWVQLAHEMLAGGVRPGDTWMNLFAGQPVEIPSYVKLGGQPELKDEAGLVIAIDAVTDPASPVTYRSRPLAKPGVYQLKLSPTQTVPIAVNVAVDEADVRTVGNDFVRKSLGDIQMTTLGDELPIEAVVAAKEGNDWAGAMLIALLVLLGAECFMAMFFGHYRRSEAVRT